MCLLLIINSKSILLDDENVQHRSELIFFQLFIKVLMFI